MVAGGNRNGADDRALDALFIGTRRIVACDALPDRVLRDADAAQPQQAAPAPWRNALWPALWQAFGG